MPQFVCLGRVLSNVVVSGTGVPQGTVRSSFLFTPQCNLQKFSDDSSVVGCITGGWEEEYRELGVLHCFVLGTN